MRDYDAGLEAEFFEVFADYYDLERSSNTRYAAGEYSLARLTPMARVAGNPETRLRIVHIAGTKGKGSTCHYTSAFIQASGRRCGLFTSPHLATVRERFQIDGSLVDYSVLIRTARSLEKGFRTLNLNPGLFEVMTVLALRLFVDAGCEWAVLETGIGGRLDATNYVSHPVCCGITPISLDHTQILGATIPEIAAEKAGIIKPGVPIVCADQPFPEALRVIEGRARELNAPFHGPVEVSELQGFVDGQTPEFQVRNAAVAKRICSCCGLNPSPDTFKEPHPRGRFECISTDPLVILDGAHNAHSAQVLVQTLTKHFPGRKFTTVLGVVPGKDIAGIFQALNSLDTHFLLVNPHTRKGSALDALTELARQAGASFTVIGDLTSRDQLPKADNYLFTGSFFTALIGEKLFS